MDTRIGEVLATATSYDELVAACRARRHELGLSQMAVDEISGLQTGYTGKLECGSKKMGVMSLSCVLGALGLELAVVRTIPHHEKQGRELGGTRGLSDAGRDRASEDLRDAA